MLNNRIRTVSRLESSLAKAEDYLSKLLSNAPFSEFEYDLQEMGFEKGWGDTAERVLEMMQLLSEILQAPDPSSLETFLVAAVQTVTVIFLIGANFASAASGYDDKTALLRAEIVPVRSRYGDTSVPSSQEDGIQRNQSDHDMIVPLPLQSNDALNCDDLRIFLVNVDGGILELLV